MDGLLFLGLIVLAVVLVLTWRRTTETMDKINQDVGLLSQRIDYLRRLIEKGEAGTGATQDRKPPAPPMPGMTVSPPPGVHPGAMPARSDSPVTPPFPPPMPPPLPVRDRPPVPYPAQVPDDFMKIEISDADQQEAAGRTQAIVDSVSTILRKMFNWLLVNEEFRPKGVTAEYAIATTWLLRVGILGLVGAASYFLRWSIEQNLIGPEARVGLCMLAGAAMIVAGLRMPGNKYSIMGQGFIGGGLLILYFSGYAAGPLYHIFGPQLSTPVAFALMICVTVAAGTIAVRTDSLLTAVIGLAGGFATPVLIRTAHPNLPVFYSYMLLLVVGMLAVSRSRQWRILNYLGFMATYVLFYASKTVYTIVDFPVAMAFLSAFFVMHSAIVYMHNVSRGNRSTVLEVLHLVANAVLFSWFGYWLIKDAYGGRYPAVMSIGLAAFYIAHVLFFLRRRLDDRKLLTTLIALAALFVTWTMPLLFEKESLTISLALLALAFLWIGRRIGSSFVVDLAYLIYLVVFVKLVGLDLMDNFGRHGGEQAPIAEYWRQMLTRLVRFGISIASVAVGFVLLRDDEAARPDDHTVSKENDLPHDLDRSMVRSAFFWFAALFAFLFAQLEISAMFTYWKPMRMPALTLVWCVAAGYFLWLYARGTVKSGVLLGAAIAFCSIAILKLFSFDLASWNFSERFVYGGEYAPVHVWARLVDFWALFLLCSVGWFTLHSRRAGKGASGFFGYAALLLLFAYSTFELNTFLSIRKPEMQAAGISMLWALFAIGFIGSGIWKNSSALRYLGLALFSLVVMKVIFVDLRHIQTIYKVVACMAVGLLLLAGAFAYIRAERKFHPGSGDRHDHDGIGDRASPDGVPADEP
ncbi:MAG: hypothetical protein C0404_13665 [Verrucomicrobia bacterium]|nr:hypothetical protein [Verrucomicrobiota bacterium]